MTVRILVGDCRTTLATLPDASVHTCVTSPPYFGLRDYGTAKWEGGDSACEHRGRVKPRHNTSGAGDSHGRFRDDRGGQPSKIYVEPVRAVCVCGAARVDLQLGLEPTPCEFVAAIVAVFREVRRVLRDDGTLWLNLGDTYNGQGKRAPNIRDDGSLSYRAGGQGINVRGLKSKDLIGIPWMVAFALRADGWYLRQDVIWHKPNPMPESVRDRCTKSHEYLFLLSKSERYYFDADAIAEPVTDSTVARVSQGGIDEQEGSHRVPGKTNGTMKAVVKRSGNKARKPASERGVSVEANGSSNGAVAGSVPWEGTTRNKRSVWTVTTQPFKGAHFATFPPALIEPCILAGAPRGGGRA